MLMNGVHKILKVSVQLDDEDSLSPGMCRHVRIAKEAKYRMRKILHILSEEKKSKYDCSK